MVAKALLDKRSNPSRAEIIEALSGNVCRCTGYDPIARAIEAAAQQLGGGEGE